MIMTTGASEYGIGVVLLSEFPNKSRKTASYAGF